MLVWKDKDSWTEDPSLAWIIKQDNSLLLIIFIFIKFQFVESLEILRIYQHQQSSTIRRSQFELKQITVLTSVFFSLFIFAEEKGLFL